MRIEKVICDQCGAECGNEWFGLTEQERVGLFQGYGKDFCTRKCREEFLEKFYQIIMA